MKKLLTALLAVFALSEGVSQEYVEDITNDICECIENVPDSLNEQEYSMRFGICILEKAMPYKKKLKKDFKINLDKDITSESRKLGELFGIKMASACPSVLMEATKLMGLDNYDEEIVETSEVVKTIEGLVTKIDNSPFVTLSVKDESGKTTKLVWLTFIQSEMELTDEYNSLFGKSIEVSYIEQEFFDPKIEEYRNFKVISKIAVYKWE